MNNGREIRDPIHGFIFRSEIEEKIIDSSVYQRLRNIKQLALANLVYPGANHTRFEHSIGVMHIAGRLAEKFDLTPDEVRLVKLTALLHDIGHGPFSHVSERVLDKYVNSDIVNSDVLEKIHESITCQIILEDNELSHLLSKREREQITDLILGKSSNDLVRNIISGPLDADKQDYLLRDSYYCGVRYGVYDIDRLLNTLCTFNDRNITYLAIPNESVYTLEQFVIAKYHMNTQVYYHKIRLITDSMIVRGIVLGIEVDDIDWLKKMYSYDGTSDFIQNYINWNDSNFFTKILSEENNKSLSYKYFNALKNRKLHKRIFTQSLPYFKDAEVIKYLSEILKFPNVINEIEKEIAKFLSDYLKVSISKEQVILNKYMFKSVKEQSKDDEGSIIVLTKDNEKSYFEQESTLFHSIDSKQSDEFLEIYAPIEYSGKEDKEKKKQEIIPNIKKIISEIAKSKISKR